jgi:predicted dinucleotide-binding enzyme
MKIGILGTGIVGETIATALVDKGHQVMMGSRTSTNEKAVAWVQKKGANASNGKFEDVVKFADIIFICLNGAIINEALQQAVVHHFKGKTVIDLTNPLDFSKGIPPSLIPKFSNTYSLGEEIQSILYDSNVVKALNTVNCKLMVDANLVNNGNHNLFICGNDIEAKNIVKHVLAENFNWKPENIVDLGDIKSARLTEAMIPFWVGVMQVLGTPLFNYQIVK